MCDKPGFLSFRNITKVLNTLTVNNTLPLIRRITEKDLLCGIQNLLVNFH